MPPLSSYKRNLLLTPNALSLYLSKGVYHFLACIWMIFMSYLPVCVCLCVHVCMHVHAFTVISALHQIFLALHFQAYCRIAFPSPLLVERCHVTCSGQWLWAECMWVTAGPTNESSVKNSLEFSFALAHSQGTFKTVPGLSAWVSGRPQRAESFCQPIMGIYYEQDFITLLKVICWWDTRVICYYSKT